MASPVSVPVCFRHPSRETYVRCTRCERPICPDCMRDASVGHQCPECVAQGRRSVRPARTAFGGSSAGQAGYVTITLIVINVLVMLASVASARNAGALAGGGLGGLLGGETPLLRWGAVLGLASYSTADLTVHGIAAGEYYRLFTGMFLHLGILHLLMNMWALWILGRVLEDALGPLRFLTLYLLAGFGGNVAVYLLTRPNSVTVGASTAIFGLFAAFFLVMRRLGRDTSSVVGILVINLVLTFAVPGISIAGHLGGLVVGGLVGAGLAYAPAKHRTPVQVGVAVAVAAVLLLLTLVRTAGLSI